MINFNFILPFKPRSSKWSLSIRSSYHNFTCIFPYRSISLNLTYRDHNIPHSYFHLHLPLFRPYQRVSLGCCEIFYCRKLAPLNKLKQEEHPLSAACDCLFNVQSDSNMAGTDLCVNKPQSVPVISEPPCTCSYTPHLEAISSTHILRTCQAWYIALCLCSYLWCYEKER
jgi:hypothetical protein